MITLQQRAKARQLIGDFAKQFMNYADLEPIDASELQIRLEELVMRVAEQIQAQERARCAEIAENGRFLHDDAPDARFGKACAQAIREQKEDV